MRLRLEVEAACFLIPMALLQMCAWHCLKVCFYLVEAAFLLCTCGRCGPHVLQFLIFAGSLLFCISGSNVIRIECDRLASLRYLFLVLLQANSSFH